MLSNRILVIGFDRRYLEFISQMKSNFFFIHLNHPSKFEPSIHITEGLIFDSQVLLDMGDILNHFKSRPIFGVGKGPSLDHVRWISSQPSVESLETLLIESLGTLRTPPKDTGKIEVGTIVKNKIIASWGLGVVRQVLEDDLFLITFPQALKVIKKENHVCHKSTLRIICSIKELKNETSE